MKYWGKKPHNIWREYIKKYTPENGICLDPFMGSGIAFFEAIKTKRKVIGFDINPLSSFIIEVLTSHFDKKSFSLEVKNILDFVNQDSIYKKLYTTPARYGCDYSIVQHFKWESGKIYQIGIMPNESEKDNIKEKKYITIPINYDFELLDFITNLNIPFVYPDEPFPPSPSFSANFINVIGGNKFSNLWTKRNLYVISLIFDRIRKINDITLQKQVIFGFIQMLHLTTKMSVPRRENAKRDFSTSWGRSTYICSNRQMEMNPLLVFESSCFGKQSAESALSMARKYLDLDNYRSALWRFGSIFRFILHLVKLVKRNRQKILT